jgi:hypothetical protein
MSTYRYIFEQTASANYTRDDFAFFQALESLKQTDPNINSSDYYRYITEYILTLKQYMPLLSEDAKAKINNNSNIINDLFKTVNQNAYSADSTKYEEIKEDLSSVWKGVYGFAPAATGTAASASGTATPSTTSAPDQATLDSAFQKYMGSSFNPNSSMDKGKMETVKKALADFQKQNNKKFDINDSDDLSKMRPIMNAAYQSEEYKKAAGGRLSSGSRPSIPAGSRTQTPAQRTATAPASPKGGPAYYVRTGFNQYRPAVQADITSNQQLFMKNPNRAAAMVYPYVKVDSRPIRRASPVR